MCVHDREADSPPLSRAKCKPDNVGGILGTVDADDDASSGSFTSQRRVGQSDDGNGTMCASSNSTTYRQEGARPIVPTAPTQHDQVTLPRFSKDGGRGRPLPGVDGDWDRWCDKPSADRRFGKYPSCQLSSTAVPLDDRGIPIDSRKRGR